MQGHSGDVYSVAFNSIGTSIVSASEDRNVKIWNLDGDCLSTLEGHKNEVLTALFDASGTRVVSGSYDKTIKVWNATSGAVISTLLGHSGGVSSVALLNDSFNLSGSKLVSASFDRTVKVWSSVSET
jgi:WD40 repeat protein